MIGKIIVVMVVALLVLFSFAYVYQYAPHDAVELERSSFEPAPIVMIDYGSVPVFSENLRFNHNNISYFIEEDCNDIRRSAMVEAFAIFADRMKIISFNEVFADADINVGCSDDHINVGERLFAAGEGGPSRIINTSVFKTIEKGKILLFDEPRCDRPTVEIHELGHVFGFDHSPNPRNIMYNVSRCDQTISDDMVDLINELYSIEALADASIRDVEAVKRGRYLDFNITVLNEGLIDIDDINLTIFADGNEVKVMNLEGIGIGYGRTLKAANIKLPSAGVEKIEFVVDSEGSVREFNEGNNAVEMVVGSQ
jgi:hypothetical protein